MSQQKHRNEDVILFCGIVFVLGLISIVIWITFKTQITEGLRWVRWAEIWVGSFLVGDDKVVRTSMGSLTLAQWRTWLRSAPISDISPDVLAVLTSVAVPPLRKMFAVLLGLMSICTIFFGHGTQYRRRMNLEGLLREQARSFPAIRPFMKFDPRKLPPRAPGAPVPAQLPLFAEALSPEEWVAYHEVAYAGGQLDRQKAYQALALQLGKRWQGPEHLPLHAQGLYAAFALKHVRKRKDAEALLDVMSSHWNADGGLKLPPKLKAQIKSIIADPKVGGALRKYADQHAWETTALLRCLARSREEGGVLAPAQFLWLRGHDRTLWYPLNNLGRKAFHAEASGALIHYINELIAGQKIPTPRFEEVIKNFETYLKSTSSRVVPELDRKAGGAKYWKGK